MTKLRIRSEADIHNLDGYKFDIVPEEDPIDTVLDRYYIQVDLQCGLKGCHTWHKEGVIVRTKSGAVTNVGHICGKRFRNYHEKYDDFKQAKLIPRYQGQVAAFKRQGTAPSSTVAALISRQNTVAARVQRFCDLFPVLGRTIQQRASRNETKVETVKERSEQEIENLMASNPSLSRERAKYSAEIIGHVIGLSAFRLDRASLANIERDLQALEPLDVLKCSFDKLHRAARLAEDFGEDLKREQSAVAEAEKFFSEKNWKLLEQLSTNPLEKQTIKAGSPTELLAPRTPATPAHQPKPPAVKPESRFDKLRRSMVRAIYGNERLD